MTELPSGWALATIADLCDVNPRRFDLEPADEDRISFVPMQAVIAGTGEISGPAVRKYRELKDKSLTRFQEYDVIFAKITPCMENGKIALATKLEGGRALGSTEFHVLRSKGAIDPSYLLHFLLQEGVRRDAERNMTGAVGQRRVPRPYIQALSIPTPPIAEQRRIVATLEEHLSQIAGGARSIEAAAGKVEQFNASLRLHAVNGWIERRERLVTTPDDSGWRTVSVAEISRNIQYGTSAKAAAFASETDIPVIRMGNIRAGKIIMDSVRYLPSDHPDNGPLRLEEGDLLFNRTNSFELVGKSAIYHMELGPATFASYLIRCQLYNEVVDPEWVALVINSPYGRTYISSVATQQVGQANVNGKKLGALQIPLPPLQRQKEILSRFREQTSAAARLTSAAELTGTKARALRSAVLRKAFTGRLVPQDASDESATIMLERLRTDQDRTPKVKQERRLGRPPTGPVQTRLGTGS